MVNAASSWSPMDLFSSYLPTPSIDFRSKIVEVFSLVAGHIDFIRQGIGVTRIVVDIEYIVRGKFLKEKTPFGIIGNLLLCFSDFGSIFPFLEYWKVIDLGKIAGVVGQVRFLAPLMRLPIGTVLSVISSVGYIFFGIDAAYRLFLPETKGPFRRQAVLDIANAVVQVTLSGMLIAGMTRLPVLIPMGGFCMVVGSVCFLHRCTLPPEPGTEKKKSMNNRSNRSKLRPIRLKKQTYFDLPPIRASRLYMRQAVEVM